MRIYLDTNISIFLLSNDERYIDDNTLEILGDSSNLIYTSSVCVQEIIHLRQVGKIFAHKKRNKSSLLPIVDMLNDYGIEIILINSLHLKKMDELPLVGKHRDPSDRLIIAQAIADRATLVSSDLMFPEYIKYGLQLHQNRK